VAFGKEHGVVVTIQNHHDFIVNADHAIDIIEKVDSDWFGLIVDTGSYWEGGQFCTN
jgi:sugar phosphate isomerase/epimerase